MARSVASGESGSQQFGLLKPTTSVGLRTFVIFNDSVDPGLVRQGQWFWGTLHKGYGPPQS